jgi:nicotinamide mononucleotide transporter
MRRRGWTPFEIGWLAVFCLVAAVLSILWRDTLFGFSVFVTGVVCVVLAAKGNLWTYAFGAYNSLAYAWVAFAAGLYGEVMLNAVYYFPMQLVGWMLWRRRMGDHSVVMRKMGLRRSLTVAVGGAVAVAGYGFWLSGFAGQNTPYIDSLTNVLSVMAMVLMALRFREQWVLFILVNAVSAVMWGIRLGAGSAEAATMLVMWSAYLVNSLYGLWNWSRGAAGPVVGLPARMPPARVPPELESGEVGA